MKPMTEKDLKDGFAGESQAHMKYLAFAKQAEEEGKPNIARLFRAVASAEIKHAHYHLRQLGGIGCTADNLTAAHAGEDFEIESMYPAFTAVGNLEGEADAVKGYHYAVEAEKNHRPMYLEARNRVESGEDADERPIYVCSYCGHTGHGAAPDKCPICGNPGENFEKF
ncbi:MAG TPA: rubrerythrin family protein [Armatimonadota bacterium]|jgi:rubrerythrin